MNVLTINDDLKVAIEWAFELAYDDQENYLKSANWQQDYGVDWPDIAEMKATMLDRLAVVVRQLGLEQFAASYESLAEQFRTSAKEEASDDDVETASPLEGRRMRTKVPDSNETTDGDMKIPIGWLATIGECADGEHYTVNWDDGPNGEDMGWCLWTEEEIRRDADLLEVSDESK